jgi:hypothetical protein
MKRPVSTSVLALAVVMFPIFAQSQNSTDPETPHLTTIEIRSNVMDAEVVLDSVHVGVTPLPPMQVTPGPHVLSLIHPERESWLTQNITDTILVEEGTSRVLRYHFTRRFIVNSQPFGAEVVLNDSLVGTTPCVLTLHREDPGQPMVVRKQGYEPFNTILGSTSGSLMDVSLKRVWNPSGELETVFREEMRTSGSTARLYVTGAATIVAGTLAAYFKVKADDRYQSYLASRSPALLSETNRFDAAAAIALAATQISLGLFTYFILSD